MPRAAKAKEPAATSRTSRFRSRGDSIASEAEAETEVATPSEKPSEKPAKRGARARSRSRTDSVVSAASDDIVAEKPKAAKRARSTKRSASEAEVIDQEEPEANNNTENALVVGEDIDVDEQEEEEEEEVPFDLDLAPGRTSQLPAPNMQLTGHEGVVYSCAFDPSGRVLASGSKDRCVFLWDVFGNESGECRNFNVLRGHKNAVLDVKWLPPIASGLVTASADQVVSLWDAERGLRVRKFAEHSAIVNCCATDTTNPAVIASGSDDCTAILWDLRASSGGGKGKQSGAATSMFHDYQVTAVALADDGTTVYTGGVDNIIRKWDLRSVRAGKSHSGTNNGGDPEGPVLTMRGHTDTITGLSVSPDGALLLSNSMDCSLRAWNLNPFVAGIDTGIIASAGAGADGSRSEGGTQPQEQGTQRYERLFQGHHHGAEKNLLKCGWSSMRGNSRGNRGEDQLLVCAGSADRVVHIWDAATAHPAYKLPGHSGSVNEVCFHPTQPIVASCSTDRTIWLGELA